MNSAGRCSTVLLTSILLLALHFKLTVEAQQPNESYQECQYVYTPKIDEDRDRVLVGLLPDYLTEEISFNRDNAPGFYRTLINALAKRPAAR